ncbi:hypothetical protein [Rhodococcoides trifolii]|uniref:hypothetical protein n=1 Tax=Rhodococcoides trifolii TaxID=908250 RepID=UPI001E56D5E5|nr:hypothetical protein [Rhodococcus trifolii]
MRTLEDALARLPVDAQVAARQLSIFELPPSEATLASYLDLTATQWGVLRNSLERENILTVDRNGQLWFHEARRSHLWNRMLGEEERYEIGQPAYTALIDQYRQSVASSTGLMVTIAHAARYALHSQQTQPILLRLLQLTQAQLAVLASVIELEITDPLDGAHWTPPETALIYAHNTFGADRLAALDALPSLLDQGFIREVPETGSANADPNISCTLVEDETDELQIVLRGRVSDVLGKSVIAQITRRVVHEQYEALRLESSRVLSDPGRTDVIDLVRRVDKELFYRFDLRDGSVCPMLAVTVDYGGQPISMAAIFNRTDYRRAAKKSAAAVDEMSYGRRVKTTRAFEDQISTIPSQKLFQAAYLASGRPIEADGRGTWWMRNPAPPLPIHEYAFRQRTLAEVLRSRLTDVEQEIYALREPRGYAVGRAPDDTYLFVELRGTTRVLDLTFEQMELLQDDKPFTFARLEHHLNLRRGESTHLFTGRTQPEGLIDDPVISLMASFWQQARDFNKHQPRYRIKARAGALTQALRSAHADTAALARALSEQLTIGGMRGHRPQHGLRVAVHLGPTESSSLVAYTQPIGDPSDVQVRFLAPTVEPSGLDDLYGSVFDNPFGDEIFGGPSASTVANLLGYDDDEIELVR